MSTPPLLPIYLLIDLTGDEAPPLTDSPVNDLLKTLAGELGSEPVLSERCRFTVVGFGETLRRHKDQVSLEHLVGPVPLRIHGLRSYADVFRALRKWLNEDQAIALPGRECMPPLVLLFTDGLSTQEDSWTGELGELIARHPGTGVVSIWCTSGEPSTALPGQTFPARAPDHDGPARVAGWVIRQHAGFPPADAGLPPADAGHPPADAGSERRRPSPTPTPNRPAEPEPPAPDDWVGAFTPYAVGHPGQAAAIRPVPDPTEWDRRDTVLDGFCVVGADNVPLLELRAASVRGRSHRYYGTVRQDDYAFRWTDDRRHLVAVVSDGVSNSKLSHKAANLIARRGCEDVAAMLARTLVEELDWAAVIQGLADQVVALGEMVIDRPTDSERLGYREVARHLAATAVFAVVDLEPVGGEIAVHTFAVGDSLAWVLRDGKHWQPQQRLKHDGEGVASSATRAIPVSGTNLGSPVVTTLRASDALVLMTDGIGDPLGDGTGSVGRFLAQMWSRPPVPFEFAAQVDFARRTHDDDRTALAIWPV